VQRWRLRWVGKPSCSPTPIIIRIIHRRQRSAPLVGRVRWWSRCVRSGSALPVHLSTHPECVGCTGEGGVIPWQRCHPSSLGGRCVHGARVRAQRPHELCVEYLAGGAALLRCQLRSHSSTAPQPDDERMQQEEPESKETSKAGQQTIAEEVVQGKSLAEEVAAAAAAPVEAAQTGRKRRRLGVIDRDFADKRSMGRCRLRDAVLGIALRGHALRGDAVPAALSPTTSSQPLLNTLITTLRRHALYLPRARAAPCDIWLWIACFLPLWLAHERHPHAGGPPPPPDQRCR
jgi:hypothetical protein